jgi:succinate dehydrogenase hydrophobic anchor subunit
MDRYMLQALTATAAAILVLVLLEAWFPARPGHVDEDQDRADPQVWAVLEEARRITQAAAEE